MNVRRTRSLHVNYASLQVFGALYTPEPAESLPGIYNFLISCRHGAGHTSEVVYPRQYAAWRDGCYLYEPLDGCLAESKSPVHFKVMVPQAASVAVVVGSEWVMLDKDEEGKWSGDIQMQKQWVGKKLSVCAAYDSSTDSYSTLLEYSL
jgi:hypothetical protein